MAEKQRLWVITELYYPENNQTGYYMTGIAEGLADNYDVKVICCQPNYAARGTLAPKNEFHKKVEIFRVWSTTLDKNNLWLRLINMLTQGSAMFIKTLSMLEKNEQVLVVSAPPTLPFVTAIAAKLKSSPYTLIIQDKYPETLGAVGKLKVDSIFYKILNYFNKILYNNAHKIIVVGRDMQQLVANQLDKTKTGTPVEVIQNWASLEEVEPCERSENEILKGLNLINKFVFLYAGNMGHPQDIESIVDCAGKLKQDSKFHFLFIGSGVKRNWLESEVKKNGLLNVTILDPMPRNQQKSFLNACDVGFVSLVKNMRGVAMPSRTYNFLAAGKPVLALTENGSEVEKIITEDRVGWCVRPQEPQELLHMIYQIYEQREDIEEMGKRARNAALHRHSQKQAIDKYKQLV